MRDRAMWLLADIARQIPHGQELHSDPAAMWLLIALEAVTSLLTLLYFAFWIWMLAHCYRTEPDRQFWIWILIIAQPIAPIAYFVLRYLPSREFPSPAFLRQWTRGRELRRLETAAHQIGNPHQFIQWGDALREVGKLDEAKDSYGQALKKDPQNIQALWGAAQIAVSQNRFEDVRSLTRQILDKDPQYKFGDVSLVYGRALKELGEFDSARSHFEQHVKRWRHPEAMYLLAELSVAQGDLAGAREYASAMIMDINGCPAAIARKHGRWMSRAKRLLKQTKT